LAVAEVAFRRAQKPVRIAAPGSPSARGRDAGGDNLDAGKEKTATQAVFLGQ
jgi:hypothetical protein